MIIMVATWALWIVGSIDHPGGMERCGSQGSRTSRWLGHPGADRESIAEVSKRHGIGEQTANTVRPHSTLGYLTAAAFAPELHQPCSGIGPRRCGIWALRASTRCTPAPSGANRANRNRHLNLTVVRRNRVGQTR